MKNFINFLHKTLVESKNATIFAALYHAKVAQLVERQPSKLNVAGSNPVFRSKKTETSVSVFLYLQLPQFISIKTFINSL